MKILITFALCLILFKFSIGTKDESLFQEDFEIETMYKTDNNFLKIKENNIKFEGILKEFKALKVMFEEIKRKETTDIMGYENLIKNITELRQEIESNLTKIEKKKKYENLEQKLRGLEKEIQSRDIKEYQRHENLFKIVNGIREVVQSNEISGKTSHEQLVKLFEDFRIEMRKKNKDEKIKHDELLQQIEEIKSKDLENAILKTRDELIQNKVMLNSLLNNLFNKWIHYKFFTDSEGKRKAFFIPMNEKYERISFEEAFNTCNKYNATLVEPNSAQKQLMLESFLGQIGLIVNKMDCFWINAKKDSSGKFKWISSGHELSYTNWWPINPHSGDNGLNYAYICPDLNKWKFSFENYGKWNTWNNKENYYVACEGEISI